MVRGYYPHPLSGAGVHGRGYLGQLLPRMSLTPAIGCPGPTSLQEDDGSLPLSSSRHRSVVLFSLLVILFPSALVLTRVRAPCTLPCLLCPSLRALPLER